MSDATATVLLIAFYSVADHWAFRCQRVGRGILLLTKDSAAAHRQLFSSIMPTQFVAIMWVRRLLWVSGAVFAWMAWRWVGLGAVLLYVFVLGPVVDGFGRFSPWPSHQRLLELIRRRIESGEAGTESTLLLPYINQIEQEMRQGIHFEKATLAKWINRASEFGETNSTEERGKKARSSKSLEIANAVGTILNEYIVINDDILSLEARKITPIPEIFKSIDFCGHEIRLGTLGDRLSEVLKNVPMMKLEEPEHIVLLEALEQYVVVLKKTIGHLQTISERMCRKLQGAKDYTLDIYNRDLAAYNVSVRAYGELGRELNRLVNSINS